MTPEPTETEKPSVTDLVRQPVQPAPRVPLNELLATIRDTDLVNAYGREIIESQLAINRFDQDWRLARVFSESGLFADAQAVNQAMTKVQLGRSWNMSPADAMQHVYFVNGKPSVQNEYLAAKMRDAGLDWDIEWHRDATGTCSGVTLWPRRMLTDGSVKPIMERRGTDQIPASVSFTKDDADRVKVKEDGKWIPLSEKSTYKSFPDDMYFWRAIARLRRRYATNILSGVMTRDEAEEIAPPQVEATREKQDAPAADFMPGKQARKRAGAAEIPGTVKTEAQDVKPEATTDSLPVTATAPVAALPWKNREHMDQILSAHKWRVGADAYIKAMSMSGWTPADLKPEGGASLAFYEKLKAMPDEVIPEKSPEIETIPWADHETMVAAFKSQQVRIGREKFAEVLNAESGFTLAEVLPTDPKTLAFYRKLESVAVPVAGELPAEKRKKLF